MGACDSRDPDAAFGGRLPADLAHLACRMIGSKTTRAVSILNALPLAAQDLCSGLRPYMKTHHLQAGVGHYGVFNGKRWETQIYPVLRNHIQSSR